MTSQEATAGPMAATSTTATHARHGEHTDTIESVDMVFREQRKLSFTYGAVFFAVTLAIPALSVWSQGWYASTILGGFTPNYLFVSLLYYGFLWVMAWTYSKKADKLDEKLMNLADGIEAAGEGRTS